jgi:elongation factor G
LTLTLLAAEAFHRLALSVCKAGLEKSKPMSLEPIVALHIIYPPADVARLVAEVHARRDEVSGVEDKEGSTVLAATVSLSETIGYPTFLRMTTNGNTRYPVCFSHHVDAPNLEGLDNSGPAAMSARVA